MNVRLPRVEFRIPRATTVSLVLAVVGLGSLATVTTLQANRVAADFATDEEVVAAVAATPTPTPLGPVEGRTLRESRALTPSGAPSGVSGGRGRAPSGVAARSQYPSFKPKQLRLPSGATAPVAGAGVREDDGSLEIPDDPRVVGWWTGGAQAGEPFGGTVIAGHVDSRRLGLGVLAEMRKVRTGQFVVLSSGRKTVTYRISSITNVPQARLAADTNVFSQEVPHRLVLITCGGEFNTKTHHYTENIIVTADPVRRSSG
jgi:hypothetical protein